jgi:serine/threonine protein kinase
MPLCEGGALSSRLADATFSDYDAARVIRSVLSALDHIHSQNVIHRDVKPDNILYRTNDPQSDILLGDFGLSKFVQDGLADSRVGTKGYQAPQILRGHLYDYKCDIWSTGVVAYELLHAKTPFNESLRESELLNRMEKSAYVIAGDVSEKAADFIRACLRPDPEERPSASELLGHPWFAQLG